MKASELFTVEGLHAVITGGARGIGHAFATALADNGAAVTLIDRDASALDAAVAALRSHGADVHGTAVDLRDRDALRRAFQEIVAERGRLDIVFANAGITAGPGFLRPDGERDPQGAIENIPPDLWDDVVAVNLTGAFATMQEAARHMKRVRAGRIIVTASVAAHKTSPMVGTPYLATKAALAHVVRQAALELASYNVLVNAILPGPFLTDMTTPEIEEGFRRASPMKRAAALNEMQGLALFLASPASSFVTGAQYVIDGGTLLGRAD